MTDVQMTDIQIAQGAKLKPISEVAAKLALPPEGWTPYGRFKAKVRPKAPGDTPGKLVLVTAINPTPAGEGKTTVSVGLADGLSRIGQKAVLCLREPSLGPVFGIKGGAAGGGYSQVVPMEELNLHFTGDLHAVTAANNLLAAAIDNHLQSGNALGLDPRRILWRRCMDMNDRALRNLAVGLGGPSNGVPREEHFNITAASEIMAILCLADGYADLKTRLSRIVVGHTYANEPVRCGALRVQGAMAALLRDAMLPNLVQTLEHTPTLIHGGPFANIAHGCNSLAATRTAMALGEIVVTEAGFGADLGAEKFLNIKCRLGGLWPAAVVVVATVRALRAHGGHDNLTRHIRNLRDGFGLPVVVAINRFTGDTAAELDAIAETCRGLGVPCSLSEGWAKGGAGCEDLARKVAALAEVGQSTPRFTYPTQASIPDKIRSIAKTLYGAGDVEFSPPARKAIDKLEKDGFGNLPVCMAKTQYSFSDNPGLKGAPEGFVMLVSDVRVSAGAGFVVALTGAIMTMPGLPKAPSYEQVDIDDDGRILGLF